MPAIKDILPKLEVRTSNRANKCKRNNKHEIPKGDLWLIVTPRGPVARDYGYCLDCGTAIVKAAQRRLAGCLAELCPSAGSTVPMACSSSPDPALAEATEDGRSD